MEFMLLMGLLPYTYGFVPTISLPLAIGDTEGMGAGHLGEVPFVPEGRFGELFPLFEECCFSQEHMGKALTPYIGKSPSCILPSCLDRLSPKPKGGLLQLFAFAVFFAFFGHVHAWCYCQGLWGQLAVPQNLSCPHQA